MVLSCIIYCVLLQVHGYHIKFYLCWLHTFRRRETKAGNPSVFASHVWCFSGARKLKDFRDVPMFLATVWSSFCLLSSMFRSVTPLFVLALHDSNVAVWVQVCLPFCLFFFAIVLIWLCSCRTIVSNFEITGYPWNVIGSQRCNLLTNCTSIFCSKSHLFLSQWEWDGKTI